MAKKKQEENPVLLILDTFWWGIKCVGIIALLCWAIYSRLWLFLMLPILWGIWDGARRPPRMK